MIKGKAILVIKSLDSKYVPFDVHPFIQSCSGNDEELDIAFEHFQLLDTNSLPLPNAAYNLSVGETLRVKVVYEFQFFQFYDGECDVDLIYHKEKVLRKQKARKIYRTDKRQ